MLPACEPRACATPVPSRAAPVALAPARNVRRVVLRMVVWELEGAAEFEGVKGLGSCGLTLRFVIAAKLTAKPVGAVASALIADYVKLNSWLMVGEKGAS